MGCVQCGRRQVDPDSGPSAWRRAVMADQQVLVCPDCQVDGWTARLDSCAACGSTALVKRLGDVVCRTCGHVSSPSDDGDPPSGPPPAREALARDVADALDRLLGRG